MRNIFLTIILGALLTVCLDAVFKQIWFVSTYHHANSLRLDICSSSKYWFVDTVTFANGNKYIGDTNWNCAPHGYGTIYYKDGDKYIGELQNGDRYGAGKFIGKSGDVFEGQWEKGELKFGSLDTSSGDWLEGPWVNSKINGTGSVITKGKIIFEGEIKDFIPHGYGKITFPDGKIYVGNVEKFQPHGFGTATLVDGTKLEGIWENGLFKEKR